MSGNWYERRKRAKPSFWTKLADPSMTTDRPEVALLLGQTYPFSKLPPEGLTAVARTAIETRVEPGDRIFREYEKLDGIYIIASGRLGEINGGELSPGDSIGELEIVTATRRTSPIEVLERTLLYRIPTEVMRAIGRADSIFSSALCERVLLRIHPTRRKGVTESPIENGRAIILHNENHNYFRLNSEDAALWNLIDGQHSVGDLMLALLRSRMSSRSRSEATEETSITPIQSSSQSSSKAGDPNAALRLCLQLQKEGFVSGLEIDDAFAHGPAKNHPFQLRKIAALGTRLWMIPGANRVIQDLYRKWGYRFFRPPAQVFMACIILAGISCFLEVGFLHWNLGAPERTPVTMQSGWLPAFYALTIASMFCHELGHSLATAWTGCEIRRTGVGWFWLGPAPFVDTSAVWTRPKRERIIVSLAGPYITLLFGSAAALASFLSEGSVSAFFWLLAAQQYVNAAFNLNPFFKLDGYYVFADLLNRPRLREDSLQWMGTGFLPALRNPREFRAHAIDLAYGLGTIFSILLFAYSALWIYRVRIFHAFGSDLHPVRAFCLAILITGFPVILAFAETADELLPRRRLTDLVSGSSR